MTQQEFIARAREILRYTVISTIIQKLILLQQRKTYKSSVLYTENLHKTLVLIYMKNMVVNYVV